MDTRKMDKVQRYVRLLCRLSVLFCTVVIGFNACSPRKSLALSVGSINAIILNDATEPYLNTETLPLVKLRIKNDYPNMNYSIYGNQFTRYTQPEIPDSLKSYFYVVDIKKHFNLYSIFGWRNDSLMRIISIFHPENDYDRRNKVKIGKYYDFQTYNINKWLFNHLHIRNTSYGDTSQYPTGNIIYEEHYGYFNTNLSDDVNGPYTRIKPHQSWYETQRQPR